LSYREEYSKGVAEDQSRVLALDGQRAAPRRPLQARADRRPNRCHGPAGLRRSAFDFHLDHPDLLRLATWARLDGRSTAAAQEQRQASYRRRAAAVRKAQRDGQITTELSPSQILDMIESLTVGWTVTARAHLKDERKLKRERSAQREAIIEAVRRIISPSSH
jgi:Tetracyclin repressor-like, C-terminal domain